MIILLFVVTANVAIPRVDQGNIQGWQVPAANTVYLQDRGKKWYRADMSGSCVRPNFNGQLGFRTGPGGRLETGSQILSRSGPCTIRSLTAIDGPPAKK